VIGSNWFRGFSHTSAAKDKFIKSYETRAQIASVLTTFLERGVDTIVAMPTSPLREAALDAQERSGRKLIWVMNPHFNIVPGGDPQNEPERALDFCREMGATVVMPHQAVTDALMDKMYKTIRDLGKYTRLIRERGMIPALSTHMPETVIYADQMGADVETYIQIYNAAGFLMQVEADWVMRIIRDARKPVLTIKPLAAGRLLPAVGLAFVWNTIREQDMVAIGTTTPDEAKEVIDLSLDFINRRLPNNELQTTRSKASLK
jgi:hypothetical protein